MNDAGQGRGDRRRAARDDTRENLVQFGKRAVGGKEPASAEPAPSTDSPMNPTPESTAVSSADTASNETAKPSAASPGQADARESQLQAQLDDAVKRFEESQRLNRQQGKDISNLQPFATQKSQEAAEYKRALDESNARIAQLEASIIHFRAQGVESETSDYLDAGEASPQLLRELQELKAWRSDMQKEVAALRGESESRRQTNENAQAEAYLIRKLERLQGWGVTDTSTLENYAKALVAGDSDAAEDIASTSRTLATIRNRNGGATGSDADMVAEVGHRSVDGTPRPRNTPPPSVEFTDEDFSGRTGKDRDSLRVKTRELLHAATQGKR